MFVKDDKNKYQLYKYLLNNPLEVSNMELIDGYLFFIPTENEYCAKVTMPSCNVINYKTN